MGLALRNVHFTLPVPGAGLYVPWWILTRGNASPWVVVWPAVALVVVGVLLYISCQCWAFATVGRGTPGPWDAPHHLVATGPYRWVRSPIYIAVLLVLLGDAWLLLSLQRVLYAVLAAFACHLFVVLYEEPTLHSRFGADYQLYRGTCGDGFHIRLDRRLRGREGVA